MLRLLQRIQRGRLSRPSGQAGRPWVRVDILLKRSVLTLVPLLCLPVATFAQITVEYYHLDALGSVRAVTDANGQVVRRHDFLPFGEEWNPQGNQDSRLFAGKERDAETGLDYFGARYYRADIGRFTTIDPVYTWQENLEDPQRWNRYAYVRNNPLKYTDPTGQYLVGCGGAATKECQKEMDRFERNRQEALSSKDEEVVRAARQYGAPGEAGVTVTPDFGGLLGGTNARTSVPDAPGADIGVLFKPGVRSLQRTIVHEGVHVGQMRGFVDSFDPVSGKYDKAQNPIVVLAELSAFQAGARVAPYWVGGTLGALGPNDTVKILQYLTRYGPYRTTLNQRFFGVSTWPQ